MLRNRLISRDIVKSVSFEELLVSTGGYGISAVDVSRACPVWNKSIADSGLREKDIMVLAIERGHEIMPNPRANVLIKTDDRLICFGKLDIIKKELYAEG